MTRFEKEVIMRALEHYSKNAETEQERNNAKVEAVVWKEYVLNEPCGTVKI